MTTKRRIPLDQLRALGDWDGPVHGQLGVLATDGDLVQCHICARWFRYLANHVWRTHHLYADEYRAYFGLRMNTGLVGPALREVHRQIGIRSFGPYWHRAPELARAQTREERAARSRGKRLALEAKLDPKNRAVWQQHGERLADWVREQQAAGTWRRPEPRDLRASVEKAVARWRELLADPAYRAEHGRKISAAKGGRVEVACATCGAQFAVPRNVAAEGRRRFCSRDCLRVFQRRFGQEVGRIATRAQRMVAKTCPVCGVDFEGFVRRRYCSSRCEQQAARAARRRQAAGVCASCGQPFVGARGQTYCSRACSTRVARASRRGSPSYVEEQKGQTDDSY